MITIKNLSKEFKLSKEQRKEQATDRKFTRAVNDLNFSCKPGEVYSLLGPNGAGKTTTLRMLATILKPTSGRIEVCGIDAVKHPREARMKIGFLTGSTGLYARLTANEIIDYFGSLYSVSSNTLKERKAYLYDLLDMNGFANKRIGQLSTGMKQKVSICRTMIHDPEILILDEPTNGLDPQGIHEIREIIRTIATNGTTILLASHLLDEVEKVCSHVVVIREGIKLYSGTVDEMTSSYGLFELKTDTNSEKLLELLLTYEGITSTKIDDDRIIATLNKAITASELNQFLYENGIILSHLVKRKPSLEQQFLSLTNNKS